MDAAKKLKPCPFCGGEARVVAADGFHEYWSVRCFGEDEQCTAEIGFHNTEEDVVAAWNRRAPSPDMREAVEARYQARVHDWMMACFNNEIAFSVQERNHRFLEEALELVQSQGCTKHEALQLVDYVYSRDAGDPPQEVGGVIVCLAALCTASCIDMDAAGETELARIWTKVDKIRAKHAAKPQFSPLPGDAALRSLTGAKP